MSDFGVADQVVQCHTKPKNGDFLTADVYLLTSFYPSRVISKQAVTIDKNHR